MKTIAVILFGVGTSLMLTGLGVSQDTINTIGWCLVSFAIGMWVDGIRMNYLLDKMDLYDEFDKRFKQLEEEE